MATNDFIPFATATGANVETQANWETDTGSGGALEGGFQSGLARSAQVNKAIRQGTVMASAAGQAIGTVTGQDALDNRDVDLLALRFQAAMGMSRMQVFTSSGTFTVPDGVTRVRVTVIGGGGAGGYNSTYASGGGGSGGRAIKTITGLVPGATVAVTVGAGGVSPGTAGSGGNGGVSSFGAYCSASGGTGGGGGTGAANAGGGPGVGSGGDLNDYGAYGTDGLQFGPGAPSTGCGGAGGGPGGGRGTSGFVTGVSANGYGGGGGGGGSGASGGAGKSGLVIVEY